MRFTKIPVTTFENLAINAGVLVDSFNPSTGVIGNILGATSGGVKSDIVPTFKDWGEDIDNAPKNTKELKKLESIEIKMSGTFVSVTANLVKKLIGAASIVGNKIIPLDDVTSADFSDLWLVADYSDKNGETNGGFIAIKYMNVLSTGGFKMTTAAKDKGKFDFEFTAHYSMANQTVVPCEIYIQAGTAEDGDYIMSVVSAAGDASGKTDVTVSEAPASGESLVYMTGYGLVIPAQGASLAGSAWTSWDGSAEISAVTGMEIVVAIKDASGNAAHAGQTTVVAND